MDVIRINIPRNFCLNFTTHAVFGYWYCTESNNAICFWIIFLTWKIVPRRVSKKLTHSSIRQAWVFAL